MHQIRTEIDIDAAPEKVWQILTDTQDYPSWNPMISRLNGKLDLGERLEVSLHQPDGKSFNAKPKVVAYSEGERFAWLGRLGIPGLFDGEHHFELKSLGEGRTRFVQWEQFKGVLVPFMKKMLDTATKEGFDQMNTALKRQAEAVSSK